MNNIYDINNIDLNNLSLNNPTSMKGSAHISKLKYNNDSFYTYNFLNVNRKMA